MNKTSNDHYNDHFYVVDETTGFVYRTVGPTDTESLVVYPKYIPSKKGKREAGDIPYRGLQYPSGSIRFLSTFNLNLPGVIKIKFSPIYGSFLPIAVRNQISLLEPQKRLYWRLRDPNTSKTIREAKQLVKIFTATKELNLEDFGLDASLLAGMEEENSDIDLVVYGENEALAARRIFEARVDNKDFRSPYTDQKVFIKRRVKYSPLMTHSEILLWEDHKISGLFKGRKFSVMPVDPSLKTFFRMSPTNLDIAIRVNLKEDKLVFDPGIIDLKKDEINVVYGPQEVPIRYIFSYLPSRMGVFLKEGETLFSCGRLYKVILRGMKETFYALTQFPWDDNYFPEGTKFVTKVEKTAFDGMIPQLFGQEFTEDDYSS